MVKPRKATGTDYAPFTVNVDASLLPDIATAFISAYPSQWEEFQKVEAAANLAPADLANGFVVVCVQGYIKDIYMAWHVQQAAAQAAADAQQAAQTNVGSMFQ